MTRKRSCCCGGTIINGGGPYVCGLPNSWVQLGSSISAFATGAADVLLTWQFNSCNAFPGAPLCQGRFKTFVTAPWLQPVEPNPWEIDWDAQAESPAIPANGGVYIIGGAGACSISTAVIAGSGGPCNPNYVSWNYTAPNTCADADGPAPGSGPPTMACPSRGVPLIDNSMIGYIQCVFSGQPRNGLPRWIIVVPPSLPAPGGLPCWGVPFYLVAGIDGSYALPQVQGSDEPSAASLMFDAGTSAWTLVAGGSFVGTIAGVSDALPGGVPVEYPPVSIHSPCASLIGTFGTFSIQPVSGT